MAKRIGYPTRRSKLTPLCGVMILSFVFNGACTNRDKNEPYTQYRDGAIAKQQRINYASFATEGEALGWNRDNCEEVASLLNRPGRGIRFWCEKGPYHP